MPDTAIVFGSTGTQGRPVARRLLDAGYRVLAVTRHPERAAAETARGAQTRSVDLNDPEAVAALAKEGDVAFLHLPLSFGGPDASDRATAVIDALIGGGVRHLVFSTSGPAPDDPIGVPMLDERARLIHHVRDSGRGTVLKPTAYMENIAAPWSAGRVAAGEFAYPRPADFRVAWITNEDVARYTEAAFARPDSIGRSYAIAGPEALDGPAAAERLARGLGRHVTYVAIRGEEYGQMMEPVVGPQMAAMVGQAYDRMPPGQDPMMTPDITPAVTDLGVEPTPMEDWARRQAWPAA